MYWLSTVEATQTKAKLSINVIVGAMDQAILEAGHLNFPGKWPNKFLLPDQSGLHIATCDTKSYDQKVLTAVQIIYL